MIKTIVLYLVIGVILSIVYTYLDYVIDYKSPVFDDLDSYFDSQFSVPMTLGMIVAWPIVLVVFVFTVGIRSLFIGAVALLDKIFGGKKND